MISALFKGMAYQKLFYNIIQLLIKIAFNYTARYFNEQAKSNENNMQKFIFFFLPFSYQAKNGETLVSRKKD